MSGLGSLGLQVYLDEALPQFHQKILTSLRELKLEQILKRKNPYLFKAKNISSPRQLVQSLLDAHLSAQEETMFGEFLECLAIEVCAKAYGGRKSSAEGIDLEFEKDGIYYLVAIKSGPHWGNSQQIERMKDNFKKAKRILLTSNGRAHVRCVNGCCYGQDPNPQKDEYEKLCGQRFWQFISGEPDFYLRLMACMGPAAQKKSGDFEQAYHQIIESFSKRFEARFCQGGMIEWEKLAAFNCGQGEVDLEIEEDTAGKAPAHANGPQMDLFGNTRGA